MLRALIVALLAFPAIAAECEPPKRLTCAELKARVTERCKPDCEPSEVREVPGPERVVTKEVRVEVPGPERVVVKRIEVPVEKQESGRAIAGGGLAYFHGPGLTAVGGYRFAGGKFEILGGPTWIPQNGRPEIRGTAVKGDVELPYVVPAGPKPSPWGAQILAVYAWD